MFARLHPLYSGDRAGERLPSTESWTKLAKDYALMVTGRANADVLYSMLGGFGYLRHLSSKWFSSPSLTLICFAMACHSIYFIHLKSCPCWATLGVPARLRTSGEHRPQAWLSRPITSTVPNKQWLHVAQEMSWMMQWLASLRLRRDARTNQGQKTFRVHTSSSYTWCSVWTVSFHIFTFFIYRNANVGQTHWTARTSTIFRPKRLLILESEHINQLNVKISNILWGNPTNNLLILSPMTKSGPSSGKWSMRSGSLREWRLKGRWGGWRVLVELVGHLKLMMLQSAKSSPLK